MLLFENICVLYVCDLKIYLGFASKRITAEPINFQLS